jgi:hypothetical protein
MWIIERIFILIALVICLQAVWEMCSGPAVSLWWHCLHGNKVSFDGHTIAIPLMWRVNRTEDGRRIVVIPAHKFPGAFFTIESLAANRITEEDSAMQWQTDTANRRTSDMSSLDGPLRAEIVRAKTTAFYCVDWVPDGEEWLFSCKAVGTNWEIRGVGEPKALKNAKKILSSIE